MENKHILITGGAGFIGSHLCDRFLGLGYAVTAVDNLITGRRKNLEDALKNPSFSLVEQDVCEPLREDSIPLLKKWGLSGVLHFACPASPVDFDKIPFEILKVDSVGTIKTVELAQKYHSRYLLASTSEVYGDPLVHPQREDYWGNVNPVGPRACYDETKRFAEAYVSTAIRLKGLNAGIVRIFNTYGPRMRMDDGRIVPELCRKLLTRQKLVIHGDGLQTRSFCFVSDLVEGIVRLFESEIKDPVNLGNPDERTVLNFAETLCQLQKGTLQLEHLPARPDDPKKRCPDITQAKKRLGWTPQVSLEEGLKITLDAFAEQL
jgi:dTDP-glucose 4,6-dehydratase